MDVGDDGITPPGETIMKRSSIVALAFAALPLLAEEPASKPEPAAEPKPAQASQPAQPAAQPDSPLVAAARRTNRLGKKPANVITNSTLTKSGSATAHVTTTETQAPLILPPPLGEPRPTPEMIAKAKADDQRKKDAAAQQKKQSDTAKWEAKMKKAAERAEEGMYDSEEDSDYGEGERDLQKAQSEKPPQV
jgi:hypothetical protein